MKNQPKIPKIGKSKIEIFQKIFGQNFDFSIFSKNRFFEIFIENPMKILIFDGIFGFEICPISNRPPAKIFER